MSARPLRTDEQVLSELIDVAGLDALDVGCGEGKLVRWLCAHGARAVGIEVSEAALTRARAQTPPDGGSFRVGSARALPVPDVSFDLVLFWRSLHHVPPPDMPGALLEARRVLRPGGAVYIAEPLPEGSFFELLRSVDDETRVRAAARTQIERAGELGLAREFTLEYETRVRVAGLDDLHDRWVGADPGREHAFHALSPTLERAAGALSEGQGEDWEFSQPMRVDLLRRVD